MTAAFACARLSSAAPATNALAPEQELKQFHFADPRLRIELVAAEPEVISPVAIAFDADGRMFVAEMIDYPTGPMSGRVRLLEDHDGDGRYETATVFAENLPFPNSVLPWRGGVLVTAAPNLWYLKDTDGDGRADERRVLFKGFAPGNQQLRANGLHWGIDNWVYGANGRSDGEVTGDALAKPVSLRGHDFRFRPGTGEFEGIAGRSQFGSPHDDWGNRFLSWNTIAMRHEVLPERYLNRNRNLASTESLLEILEPGDTGRVFPLAPPPLTFNDESITHFNALAGLTIYRGDALGDEYRGNAFMGEALLNLVHRRVLQPDGVSFVARRGEHDKEFFASRDPWFHAVNFATGPDGALYVVDFYRRFVEHPDFVHGPERNTVPWRTGFEHGRIWKIWDPAHKLNTQKPNLANATSAELVAHLNDENGWWRDTAQRLLVERQDRVATPALEQLARSGKSPLGRLHALYTLAGLGALTPDLVQAALHDSDPRLREHGIRLSEQFRTVRVQPAAGGDLQPALIALADDPEIRVRFQLALSLGGTDAESQLSALAHLARRDCGDRWCALAILSSVGSNSWAFLNQVVKEYPQWLTACTSGQAKFLEQTAALIGVSHTPAELRDCLGLITQTNTFARAQLAMLTGLADGLGRSSTPLSRLLNNPPPELNDELQALKQDFGTVRRIATSSEQAIPERVLAIHILGRGTSALAGEGMLDLLQPGQPAEVQASAARAIFELNDQDLAKALFGRWLQFPPASRRRILSATPTSPVATIALLEMIESGKLSTVEVDLPLRQALLRTQNDSIKQRFKKVFEVPASDREEVVRRFQPALTLAGNRERGAAIFSRTCLTCHGVEGKGGHVGPDLSGVASRPKQALLVDVIDPSRAVSADFVNYTVETTAGTTISGLIVAETASSVALRRANEPDATILRSEIKELRAEGKSLMPEGLEQGLNDQDIADLLTFLQKPEGRLLLEVK